MQHDVPGAEELGREEVGHGAVGSRLGIVLPDQVVHVAVEDEQAGGAREILVGELAGPAGKPLRHGERHRRPASAGAADEPAGRPAETGVSRRLGFDVPFATDRVS